MGSTRCAGPARPGVRPTREYDAAAAQAYATAAEEAVSARDRDEALRQAQAAAAFAASAHVDGPDTGDTDAAAAAFAAGEAAARAWRAAGAIPPGDPWWWPWGEAE